VLDNSFEERIPNRVYEFGLRIVVAVFGKYRNFRLVGLGAVTVAIVTSNRMEILNLLYLEKYSTFLC
jgi:hypothetical protein